MMELQQLNRVPTPTPTPTPTPPADCTLSYLKLCLELPNCGVPLASRQYKIVENHF